MKIPVSVIILTYNEQKNLASTLEAIYAWVDEIFVVDSFSKDRTIEIAESYGAVVVQQAFETHSLQWSFALSQLPVKNNWILGLDADQQIMPELAQEIKALFLDKEPTYSGYYVKRRMFFLDKWIRHGGYYPLYLLKLFRKDAVFIDEGEMMDHHFYVRGKTSRLNNDLIEANQNETLEFWLNKHIRYAKLQASEELYRSRNASSHANLFGNQDERRQSLKNTWEKLPLFLRPFLYFFYRYFLQLGVLDGRTGLIFHLLQAFWYRFIVDAKIYEARKALKRVSHQNSLNNEPDQPQPVR